MCDWNLKYVKKKKKKINEIKDNKMLITTCEGLQTHSNLTVRLQCSYVPNKGCLFWDFEWQEADAAVT